ncbi:MAG TPA: symmetrical bis(5'-nucleosyl)-tetraphosphatase [Candidatus Binatia bacterium]|nr:symmetrical bis(5'-nucleosyl)-tetraphosphatase [Candidatus Binatia bacterium]
MSTWAVGDVQGCDVTLERLLARIRFGTGDRLLFVGDLVNRGARSLEVLRRVRALGDRAVVVLGNHDLHLLARAMGVAERKRRDTLEEVLTAPDAAELLGWLRARPLLHEEHDLVLVHAGLLPAWSVADAAAWARRLETELRGPGAAALLAGENPPTALYALTRVRLVRDGEMVLDYDGPPDQAPRGAVPWFAAPARRWQGARVVFGHWSALGLHVSPEAVGLDTGCVWGRTLTAWNAGDGSIVQEPQATEDRVKP